MPYEVLEHTADIGFRARAATWPDLLAQAAEALTAIYPDASQARPVQRWPITVHGEDRDDLLVNWLNEVLYLIDGAGVAPCRFHAQVDGATATGAAWGEPRSGAHPARLIVKGVTYHQLRISESAAGWECEVFLDI